MTGAIHLALMFVLPLAAGDGTKLASTGPGPIISAELLRQSLSDKARATLVKAQHAIVAGDHKRAIEILEPARVKFPESAAWTESMLGVEYL